MRLRRIIPGHLLTIVSALFMAVALVFTFLIAPREAVMGDVQRIFYFHVAAAWTGYLALVVAFLASVLCLTRGPGRWDGLALSSVEIGLVFVTEGIVSGSIWAKAAWGVWWTWDPRLTTSAVLWLIYASYLTLRKAVQEESRRARIAAVYAVMGFAAVPINFMAIRWWRTVHPVVLESSGLHLGPTMLATLVLSVVAFTLLYFTLLRLRLRLQDAGDRIESLMRCPGGVS